MLNVGQNQFMVLLLVIQTEDDPSRYLSIHLVRKQSFHLLINVSAESHNVLV